MKRNSYLANINFLVVDDNAFIRTTVRRVLEALGACRTQEAADGWEALRIMDNWSADIILTDWEMAILDGIEFTKTIRQSQNLVHRFLPIIIVSGHSEAWRIATARDAGVTEYMVKPISVATMFARIRNVIENPRPFIRAPGYFGPDRRRRNTPVTIERRQTDPTAIHPDGGLPPGALKPLSPLPRGAGITMPSYKPPPTPPSPRTWT